MRRDMFEVIIERPRVNRGAAKKKRTGERTQRAFERAPNKASMSRGRGTKCLNENLAPLRRFLRSRTGLPWSHVHSEMCAHISAGSAVQKHILDHVKHMIEEQPVFIHGKAHHPAASGGKHLPIRTHPTWPHFYVCPKTGLLREAREPPASKKKA